MIYAVLESTDYKELGMSSLIDIKTLFQKMISKGKKSERSQRIHVIKSEPGKEKEAYLAYMNGQEIPKEKATL